MYDIEQQTEQLGTESLKSEKRLLKSETRLTLLKNVDKRLVELESGLNAFLVIADSSSLTPPATGSNE